MISVIYVLDGKEVEDTIGTKDIKFAEKLLRGHYGDRFGGIVKWHIITQEEVMKKLRQDYMDNLDHYYYAGARKDEDYTPSATRGDYSPANPWDAEGMSISDFI